MHHKGHYVHYASPTQISTGEEKDLEVVRKWARRFAEPYHDGKKRFTDAVHALAYAGVPMAEYYLRTGDKEVLPLIQAMADSAKRNHYHGGFGARGGVPFLYMGGGHKNIVGTHAATFLMLAKECGVDVDEFTLQSVLKHFYRFAGRGNNPYGDHYPERGFVDNGKCGELAFTMAAAASLTPGGENSLYAHARDVSAVRSFYSGSYMLHGHTGGGIGETWRAAAMGLLYEKNPKKFREFMDNRKWFYDMSRHYDGTFGILQGGGKYWRDRGWWGAAMALSYTIPRKQLIIAGAPKTKYCRSYKLPDRPWGTAADDAFVSLKAGVDKDGGSR